jgi:hypothetical protein
MLRKNLGLFTPLQQPEVTAVPGYPRFNAMQREGIHNHYMWINQIFEYSDLEQRDPDTFVRLKTAYEASKANQQTRPKNRERLGSSLRPDPSKSSK